MPIIDDVSEALKEAMRSKDQVRTIALRNVRAGFISAMKEDGSTTLPDEKCLAVLRRLQKQLIESIVAFEAGGRADLATNEKAELAVIEGFLPKLADEATTRAWVVEAIAAAGATSKKEAGKVMGALNKAHKGLFDNKLAQQIATELLPG